MVWQRQTLRSGGEPAGAASFAVDDAALIARMAQGDQSALAELYGRYVRTLLALAHGVLGSRPEAEDVIHDVFLEVWRHCAEYDPQRASVRTWLLMRVRSRSLDRLRSSSRRQSVLDHAVRHATETVAARPEIDDRERMMGALPNMPETQQQVIRLGYFEGLSSVEIAERLGIPVGTVKSRTRAALSALRDALGMRDESAH